MRGRLTLLQRMELAGNIAPEMLLQAVLKADMDNIRSTIEYADTAVFNTVVERMQAARTIMEELLEAHRGLMPQFD